MANKENLPPFNPNTTALLSQNSNPTLRRPKHHTSRGRGDSPLKVRKTRENLRQSLQTDNFPVFSCVHEGEYERYSMIAPLVLETDSRPSNDSSGFDATPAVEKSSETSTLQRQRSISRRVLSRVKQGIASRSTSSFSIRPTDSDSTVLRRLSGKGKPKNSGGEQDQILEFPRGRTVDDMIDMQHFTCYSATEPSNSICKASLIPVRSSSSKVTPGESDQNNFARASVPEFASLPHHPSSLFNTTGRRFEQPENHGASLSNTSTTITTPCVALTVLMDCETINMNSRKDIWIAVEASIETQSTSLIIDNQALKINYEHQNQHVALTESFAPQTREQITAGYFSSNIVGRISSLQLHCRPMKNCRIWEVVGQQKVKDLFVGQKCSLFIKLHVPSAGVRDRENSVDQKSLYKELESMMGTLMSDVLRVEARYCHSLLPDDSVVAVHRICRIRRLDPSSTWSVLHPTDLSAKHLAVHAKLENYLSTAFAPQQAHNLLGFYLPFASSDGSIASHSINESPKQSLNGQTQDMSGNLAASAIVRDDALKFSTEGGRTPVLSSINSEPPQTTDLKDRAYSHETSPRFLKSLMPNSLVLKPCKPPSNSAPRTTTALSDPCGALSVANEPDDARQLWRHLRRTSLSTKQLEDFIPEQIQQLEASDAAVRELRRTAIANKRSVGAETLRAWRWEGKGQSQTGQGETPWL